MMIYFIFSKSLAINEKLNIQTFLHFILKPDDEITAEKEMEIEFLKLVMEHFNKGSQLAIYFLNISFFY
jgi:hypothetical protein